ncbi:Arsenate reductase [hydrothermal vent metagenome]|uniref:Arsenate reductase n=1 Tax=hydrothermal vent metagenome TaxID=652676 RepID=A0A1W1BYP2_9ZZZZ
MKTLIYHNPKCSKSRATKDILEEKNMEYQVIEYLKNPPTKQELKEILFGLGISAKELMRTGESEYKTQNLANKNDEEMLIQAMINTPILIERPIVKTDKGIIIGRPPENVLKIL